MNFINSKWFTYSTASSMIYLIFLFSLMFPSKNNLLKKHWSRNHNFTLKFIAFFISCLLSMSFIHSFSSVALIPFWKHLNCEENDQLSNLLQSLPTNNPWGIPAEFQQTAFQTPSAMRIDALVPSKLDRWFWFEDGMILFQTVICRWEESAREIYNCSQRAFLPMPSIVRILLQVRVIDRCRDNHSHRMTFLAYLLL